MLQKLTKPANVNAITDIVTITLEVGETPNAAAKMKAEPPLKTINKPAGKDFDITELINRP